MVLRKTNKIRATSQPSGEYHHLELRAIELPKMGNPLVNYNGIAQKMVKNDLDFAFDHLQMS